MESQDPAQSLFNSIPFGMNRLRSILWLPSYANWVDNGGYDYRNMVRHFVSSLCNKIQNNISGDVKNESLYLPISKIDFPSSMGNIVDQIYTGVANLLSLYSNHGSFEISVPPLAFHGFNVSIMDAAQCDLSIKRNDEITLFFVDPFPPGSIWNISDVEKMYLNGLGYSYTKTMADLMDTDASKISTLIVNLHDLGTILTCEPDMEDITKMSEILFATATGNLYDTLKTFDEKIDMREKIVSKELYGQNRN